MKLLFQVLALAPTSLHIANTNDLMQSKYHQPLARPFNMVSGEFVRTDGDTDSFCAVCGVPFKKSEEDLAELPVTAIS